MWNESVGSLSDNDGEGDGDGNEDVKKAIGLLRKTTSLHEHHAFFVHFFTVHARLSMWKCLTASFTEDVNKVQIISFSLSKCIPQEINFIEIGLVCHFQQIGINATKFLQTGIHFKSDVFTAVAVVDAKVP